MTDLDLPWKDTEAEGYRADDRMVMDAGVPKLDYEETQLTADGRVTDVRTSKIPLRNPEGDVIGVLGTFEDITERKRAEKRLKESEARLQGIVSNTNAAIHLTDSAGRLMLVNRQFAKLLGVSEKRAVGKTVTGARRFRGHRSSPWRSGSSRSARPAGRCRWKRRCPRRPAPRTYVSLTFPLLDASGAVYAVCGISTDITQIKLAEDELRKKDLAIRRAYVDVIAAVTGNKLILMTPEEIEERLGEPLGPSRRISSYKPLSVARAEIRRTIEEHVPDAGNLDEFIVGVGEGLTNAIKHGGGGRYQVRHRDGIAQVVISDKGPGVDFTTVPRATLEVGILDRGHPGDGLRDHARDERPGPALDAAGHDDTGARARAVAAAHRSFAASTRRARRHPRRSDSMSVGGRPARDIACATRSMSYSTRCVSIPTHTSPLPQAEAAGSSGANGDTSASEPIATSTQPARGSPSFGLPTEPLLT